MRAAASLALAILLAGCAPAPRAPADGLPAAGSGETILVGRVELVPALRKDEQRLRGIGTGSFENRIFLLTDERDRTLPRPPAVADYAGRIEADLGKLFVVRSDSRPFYILGGVLFLDVGGSSMNRAYFPGRLRVALRPGDRAVYIGTLRYHRDEFFEITKVTVVDEYAAASAEFGRKFGDGTPLRKALMAPVK